VKRTAIPITLLAAFLAACSNSNSTNGSGEPAHKPHAVQVQMSGFAFSPAVTNIAVGDTVTFHNSDIVPHNVTSGTAFNSDSIRVNADWRWVADRKGRFDYICAYHPTMKGSIVVE
jgi:plastocyanin